MADVKISELPEATSVDSPDLVPIVQAGSTKKSTVSLFQAFLKFIGLDFTGSTWQFINDSGIWADATNNDNFLLGPLAGDQLTAPGTTNTGFGFKAFEPTQTIGQGNTGVGQKVFNTRSVAGSFNTLVGSLAKLSDENISNAVGIGENVSVGDTSIAIGGVAEAGGVGSITIGYLLTNNEDDSIAIGGYADVGNHTATIGSSTTTDFYANPLGTSILHGKGDAIVFPDSDPHIVGAAYWVAGALVRSAG